MTYKLIFSVSLFLLTNHCTIAQTFKVDTLLFNGANGRLTFVFLGDGYQEKELGLYKSQVDSMIMELFAYSPFIEYKNYFNILSINVPSNESGVSTKENQVDNYFGSYILEDLLLFSVPKSMKLDSVARVNSPGPYQIVLLENTVKGSSGASDVIYIKGSSPDAIVHEMGHALGGLGDEYWSYKHQANMQEESPNVTKEGDPTKVKWRHWLGEAGIGVVNFEREYENLPFDYYKPSNHCNMNTADTTFCVVCKEAIIERIHMYTTPIENFHPSSLATLTSDSIYFQTDIIYPEPNTLSLQWYLNDTLLDGKSANKYLPTSSLKEGKNYLKLKIIDTTSSYRKSLEYGYYVFWTIEKLKSEAKISGYKDLITFDSLLTTTDKIPLEENLSFIISPNPAYNANLSVELYLNQPTEVSISIWDLHGAEIYSASHKILNPANPRLKIAISDLNPGIYLIKVTTGKESSVKRFIKF